MTCKHPNIEFTNGIGRRGNEGLAQVSGRCAACKAPLIFQPQPTLSLDGQNFQIPFVYGEAPAQAAPEVPVVTYGDRRAVN